MRSDEGHADLAFPSAAYFQFANDADEYGNMLLQMKRKCEMRVDKYVFAEKVIVERK